MFRAPPFVLICLLAAQGALAEDAAPAKTPAEKAGAAGAARSKLFEKIGPTTAVFT